MSSAALPPPVPIFVDFALCLMGIDDFVPIAFDVDGGGGGGSDIRFFSLPSPGIRFSTLSPFFFTNFSKLFSSFSVFCMKFRDISSSSSSSAKLGALAN